MNVATNNKSIQDVNEVGTLRLRGLLLQQPQEIAIPEKPTTLANGSQERCTSSIFSTQSGNSCRLCLQKHTDSLGKKIAINRDLGFGKITPEERSFRCGNQPLGQHRASDLKTREEVQKVIDDLFKLQYPVKSPLDFRPNGEPYEHGTPKMRREIFQRFRTCLQRGIPRGIIPNTAFKMTPYDCLNWVKQYGRTNTTFFEFLETDDIGESLGSKNYGWGTRLLLKLACKNPNYQNYSFPVSGYREPMELKCQSKNGVRLKDPAHQFALSIQLESGKKMVSYYSDCEDLQAPKPSATEVQSGG